MTTLAAALESLQLGHLKPGDDATGGMAPPLAEALEQTTTAIWSDLFATMMNTSLERDIGNIPRGKRLVVQGVETFGEGRKQQHPIGNALGAWQTHRSGGLPHGRQIDEFH